MPAEYLFEAIPLRITAEVLFSLRSNNQLTVVAVAIQYPSDIEHRFLLTENRGVCCSQLYAPAIIISFHLFSDH